MLCHYQNIERSVCDVGLHTVQLTVPPSGADQLRLHRALAVVEEGGYSVMITEVFVHHLVTWLGVKSSPSRFSR